MPHARPLIAVLAATALGAATGCSVLADWSHLTSGGTGGSAGGGGDAGHAGGAGGHGGANMGGSGGAGGDKGCKGKKGAKEVDLGAFCIDATETTNAEYQAFLDDKGETPKPGDQPPYCSWNTTYRPPSATWPFMTGADDQPVGNVDWCDAYVYCQWAGKRLCGKIGGGTNDPSEAANEAMSQWFYACTGGSSSNVYPYADAYQPDTCQGQDNTNGSLLVDVGSDEACHGRGPSAAIFDMSGNIDEWEDSCDGQTGDMDSCLVRGGDSADSAFYLRCSQNANVKKLLRSKPTELKGIRCCSD